MVPRAMRRAPVGGRKPPRLVAAAPASAAAPAAAAAPVPAGGLSNDAFRSLLMKGADKS